MFSNGYKFKLFSLFFSSLSLFSCGQSGDLYLPMQSAENKAPAPQIEQKEVTNPDITIDGEKINLEEHGNFGILSSALALLPDKNESPNLPKRVILPALWMMGPALLYKQGDSIASLIRRNEENIRRDQAEISRTQLGLSKKDIISALEYTQHQKKPTVLRVVSGYLITEADNLNKYTVVYIAQGPYLMFSSKDGESSVQLRRRIDEYFQRDHTVKRLHTVELIRKVEKQYLIYVPIEV